MDYGQKIGNSAKDHYFIKFHDISKTMFINTSEENSFFIFLIVLPWLKIS